MKKVLLSLSIVAGLAMTSCGGLDMCGCAEQGLEVMKEMEAADGDESKIKEIEEKYSAEKEVCEKVAEEFEKEMKEATKDMGPDEVMKYMEEQMGSCDALKEMMGGAH